MVYRKLERKEYWKIITISDALYIRDTKSVGGKVRMLALKQNENVCPLEWRSHTIRNVCTLTKDAETRVAYESMMTGVFTVERIEKILFRDI